MNTVLEMGEEVPNDETIAALKEVEHMKQNLFEGQSYADVDQMMEDLLYGE